MASIVPCKDKYRAYLYVNGIRKTGTFRTLREAKAWSSATENELRLNKSKSEAFKKKLKLLVNHEELENILQRKTAIPNFCGIYFLFSNGEIIYIGKSKNILSRLSKHASNGRLFDEYIAIPCPEEQMGELEKNYIKHFNPIQNKEKYFK